MKNDKAVSNPCLASLDLILSKGGKCLYRTAIYPWTDKIKNVKILRFDSRNFLVASFINKIDRVEQLLLSAEKENYFAQSLFPSHV